MFHKTLSSPYNFFLFTQISFYISKLEEHRIPDKKNVAKEGEKSSSRIQYGIHGVSTLRGFSC